MAFGFIKKVWAQRPWRKTKIRKKLKSAKKRIEATTGIGAREMFWHRSRPGELRPAAIERERHIVLTNYPSKNDRSEIHTHAPNEECFPAPEDLRGFFQDIQFFQIKNMHVVSLSGKNAVNGRYSVHATKKLVELLKRPLAEEVKERIAIKRKLREISYPVNYNQMLPFIGFLRKENLIKTKIIPMKGYKFENGYFVKKKK